MRQTDSFSREAAILGRIAGSDQLPWSAATAKGILTLEFDPSDRDRMHGLAAKARQGELTPDEQADVEAYSRVGSLLGILKSKARRSLKRRAGGVKAKTH